MLIQFFVLFSIKTTFVIEKMTSRRWHFLRDDSCAWKFKLTWAKLNAGSAKWHENPIITQEISPDPDMLFTHHLVWPRWSKLLALQQENMEALRSSHALPSVKHDATHTTSSFAFLPFSLLPFPQYFLTLFSLSDTNELFFRFIVKFFPPDPGQLKRGLTR